MFRRELIQSASVLSVASVLPVAAFAQQPQQPQQPQQQQRAYQEGTEYVALDKRVPGDNAAGKVEIIEFFWYNCQHCNAFEPRLEQWAAKLPKDVTLRRVPVAFREDFAPQQRLFYVLEAMGKVEALHKKVFYAIHVEKKQLTNQSAIGEWIATQGVDKKKFDELYESFAVQTKATRAAKLQNDFKVSGVPSLGIAGRFYTDGAMAQSMERALQITDFLISEVKKGR